VVSAKSVIERPMRLASTASTCASVKACTVVSISPPAGPMAVIAEPAPVNGAALAVIAAGNVAAVPRFAGVSSGATAFEFAAS